MAHGMQRRTGKSEYAEFMIECGFNRGEAVPCLFNHSKRTLKAAVHGDDFTVLGSAEDLNWFRKKISDKFEVKFRGRIGPNSTDDKAIRLLNRVFEWTPEGIFIEADQRHAELIVKDMGLALNSKGMSTPGIKLKEEEETCEG